MDTKGAEELKIGKFKEAILTEIFIAYQESGTLYQKTTDPEIRRTILDLKRCYDLTIRHLSPLGVHAEKRWDEMKTPFAIQPGHASQSHDLPDGVGTPIRLED
jgi:hypothetical protein